MSSAPGQIQFALVSHTNAGKTTLARTLVGADVGEVRDAAHVTLASESHLLLATEAGDQLLLWDTPGFGDSVRLFKRLRMANNPLGWFLREVLDRYRDRPFWLSQQAMRTARDEADVVLYLVNSAEHPKDAGYLAPEMQILQWLDKPVVVLLNQMGPPRPAAQEKAEQARWHEAMASWPAVHKVLPLDAFARCWIHEQVFFEALRAQIPPEKKAGYERLLQAWQQANEQRFARAISLLASSLVAAARDSQAVGSDAGAGPASWFKALGRGGGEQRAAKAMDVMVQRLNQRMAATTAELLRVHRLDPAHAATIAARVEKGYKLQAPVDASQAGLLGALLSGAATGFGADLMSGGLSMGAGALVGAVVGALTFSGAAWAFNANSDQTRVRFSDEFLHGLVVTGLLRYLAVAHFGRGRGNFVESEAPPFWQQEAEAAVAGAEQAWAVVWQYCRAETGGAQAQQQVEEVFGRLLRTVLERLYPAHQAHQANQSPSAHQPAGRIN